MVAFRVHAPTSGALLLDIFANAVTPREYLTGEPMKFKSVCKFKIVCRDLQTVMVPLPDCASGEWGPMKANRSVRGAGGGEWGIHEGQQVSPSAGGGARGRERAGTGRDQLGLVLACV